MRNIDYIVISFVGALLLICGPARGQNPLVTASTCVTVRYVSGIWLSRSGTRVAYLVKEPNLQENRNDYKLYVKDLDEQTTSPERLLVTGVDISYVQWTGDDAKIAMRIAADGIDTILIVNVASGVKEYPVSVKDNVELFSIDTAGKTIAYSVLDTGAKKFQLREVTAEQKANGYLVDFADRAKADYSTSTIYLQHQGPAGDWSVPQQLAIEDLSSRVRKSHLKYLYHLSLSPNGQLLFFTFIPDQVPEKWKRNPIIKTAAALELMALYAVDTGKTTLPFKMGYVHAEPVWSRDSSVIFLNTHSPIGSSWETRDATDHKISANDVHLFAVNVESGKDIEVLRHIPYHDQGPLFVLPSGDLMVRTDRLSVARLQLSEGAWREVERRTLPESNGSWYRFVTSNGAKIIGVHESVSTPEDVFMYQPGDSQIHRLSDLNPQLRSLQFAPVEKVNWTTSEGLKVDGFLFMPLNYVPGHRYPLVIQTKGESGWFACDDGSPHYPSFAPQPIASAGIMYLARAYGDDWDYQAEAEARPKGYPGNVGEAVQQMDIWDSAVDYLANRGLVDPGKVGIIGFSRTGWHTEYVLAHSPIRYAAATAADNIHYSLTEYWLYPGVPDLERMYGGPPYGATFDNWRRFSVSFNLDKIHTPLLMEGMGNGLNDDNADLIPRSLAIQYEVFNGLTRLGKPVELYYYPEEDHAPNHPKARLASLQRNVDWYRFWLQEYEDMDPSKKDQYERWRRLKVLHEKDLREEDPAPRTNGDR
jgi:dipeptidyl aminopeptidase/acylaminoacyl peptidase